jgi:two-component system, NarL family, response regulator LiaR
MGDRAKAVVIHGLRDLLGTSLITALNARGFDVTRAEQTVGPAIALVDLDVPGSSRAVGRAASRGWTVIGLASDDVAVAAAVAAGAAGCFPKSAPLPKLTDLLNAAAAGREVMDPAERERLRSLHLAREQTRQTWAQRLEQLSPREREVLQLLDGGLRAGDIAERLFLSVATIRTHIQNVLNKLEVGSQERAVAIYRAMVVR